jgi:hypothetical protein
MSTNLPIEVSDQAFRALASAAGNVGKTPAELAADVVERAYGLQRTKTDPKAAQGEFEKCFGSINLGTPIGVENADIDRDLARAYESSAGSQD